MAELFGRQTGVSGGRGGSMHMFDGEKRFMGGYGIVGGNLPLAAGIALSSDYRGTEEVTVCVFGDGAANQGTFGETLNIAALWKLPMVFLCENNQWAGGTHISRGLAARSPHELGEAYGIPHRAVDGNDIAVMTGAARAAIDHARGGAGPFLLEAMTFRISPHAVRELPRADERGDETLRHWRDRDPIALHAQSMRERGVAGQTELDAVLAGVEECLDDAVRFAEASPFPTLPDALEGVFAS
jgi:pyruvate dehydrogenase E1 component alpha subunit